ncbi:hypothetical protein HYE67_007591 [Fusarium culmorum]|uniref:Zn(2)-C6 fungal-type domain-containing protein n=1 Tax=Fusarium culmorum TaxID=5516 RepID=A0A2T4H1N9_FUSCU|nr:hypothetical protein FCULG_00008687 [Fusarium culmorum]QPC65360.1 hypothetical protein HYE67_007591 [Fusarium culmorum]
MASTRSRPSPSSSSPYDFDSIPDEESWQYIDYTGANSGPSSIGFISDPASGSLGSFTMVGNVNGTTSPFMPANTHTSYATTPPYIPANNSSPFMLGNTPSPSAPSPLILGDMDQTAFFTNNPSFQGPSDNTNSDMFATTTDGGFGQTQGFLTPQQYLFSQQDTTQFQPQDLNGMPEKRGMASPSVQGADTATDMTLMQNFGTDMFSMDVNSQVQVPQMNFNMQPPMQSDPNVPPWNQTNMRGSESIFIMDDFNNSPSPASNYSQTSFPSSNASPNGSKSPSSLPIRKVKAGKVEKMKKKATAEQSGKFVIVTPNSISAHAGRPNPFECFEAMNRTSQRGRKGPLANATKENALQVRRHGACFCCHSRKVKCDLERPCKNCKKITVQVPQVVCWRFNDFLGILFPEYVRGHLAKDQMTKFFSENIASFHVQGVEQACSVELFSGPLFSTVLPIQAKFFTPKTEEVTSHWQLQNVGGNRVELKSNRAANIGVELDNTAERDTLRKRTKRYIQDLLAEPYFVDQVTDNFQSTCLPQKVLRIVKQYADETESLMVKRALSIYCMHYIMTRQLCLTRQTADVLRSTGLIDQGDNYVTPRVLARQIKSIVDELMQREMSQLFDLFTKSLKPKSRREWAPCTAAFLVLCLFMEAVETAADIFVISQNEINMRKSARPEYQRSLALSTCAEVENMPFRQFAYQFHQIYQTHSKEANTKGFNPLLDNSFAEQGELDGPAIKFSAQLRELLFGESWQELQFLAANDWLNNNASHPFPMDPQTLYTGRLVARFLVSFQDDRAIFGDAV